MKYAVDHARRTADALILPHSFNARGAALERSVEGMYRTLAVWLLDQFPKVIKKDLEATYLTGHEGDSWPLAELERLLKDAVGKMKGRSVVFFIDALDECPREEVQRMLGMFRDLVWKTWEEGRQGKLRVCFASRPYPNITFHDAIFIDLCNQFEHNRDISAYIDNRLRIGESDMAVQVRKTIDVKAAGIFMWAILVVEDMNKEYDDGNIHRLQLRLESIPATLHELYRHTLERYPESRDALLVCFRWKLFAFGALTTDQPWWGIQLGLGRDEDDFTEEYCQESSHDRARQIVSISPGLLVLDLPTRHTPYRGIWDSRVEWIHEVTFAHESVRDFIFEEDNPNVERNQDDFVAQSHVLLRDWCVSELSKRRTQMGGPAGRSEEDTEPQLELMKATYPQPQYPLAPYAAKHAIYHSEAAQRHGRDQALFIKHLAAYPDPAALIYYDPYYRATRDALLQLLIISGSASLIARTQLEPARDARQSGKAFLIRPEVHPAFKGPHLVLFRDSPKAVQSLLYIYLELEPRQHQLQQMLSELLTRWNEGNTVATPRAFSCRADIAAAV